MITLSCYPDNNYLVILIIWSCYHDNTLLYFFPENFTHCLHCLYLFDFPLRATLINDIHVLSTIRYLRCMGRQLVILLLPRLELPLLPCSALHGTHGKKNCCTALPHCNQTGWKVTKSESCTVKKLYIESQHCIFVCTFFAWNMPCNNLITHDLNAEFFFTSVSTVWTQYL
jgi:hypothetical protein